MDLDPYLILDALRGFCILPYRLEPTSPQLYNQEVLARAQELVNQELWATIYWEYTIKIVS